MSKPLQRALVWMRRDLRCDDHAALYHALCQAQQVWCVFVFDTDILDSLPRQDRRVEFIREGLVQLDAELAALALGAGVQGAGLLVRHGKAPQEVVALASQLQVQAVFANHDDEPAALARDDAVRHALQRQGMALLTSKDHVVFERSEVLTRTGTPYTVFTPYKRAWLQKVQEAGPFYLSSYKVQRHAGALAPRPDTPAKAVPELKTLGFEPTNLAQLAIPTGSAGAQAMLAQFLDTGMARYDQARDYPAVRGVSYLSTHLRFGTLSIRQAAALAWQRSQDTKHPGSAGAATWLSELIWRDFYHQLLHHHPHVVNSSFRPEYDAVQWSQGPAADALFEAWAAGQTGYPLVDAAMAQLNTTGYMHNRLRMVVASFLTKDLGLHWQRGEAYFALHLNDFDLAANNGGWQWAASTGCDAQPWFRIFNPVSQSQRFDGAGKFIRRYLPVLAKLPDALIHAPWLARPVDLGAAGVELGRNYPWPVVQHDAARAETLLRFGRIKKPAQSG